MANKQVDPWDIDPTEAQKKRNEYNNKASGIPCPSKNLIGDRVCKVCEKMKTLWNFPKGSTERTTYEKKKATFNFFMNILLPDNRDKSYILQVGKNAGDEIISSIDDKIKNWKSISNPKAGKGMLTAIKKLKKDGQISYDVYVLNDRPDWDVPNEIIENLPSLYREDIVKMFEDNEFTDDNFINISKFLKEGETLIFRILPHWNPDTRNGTPLEFLARHWWTSADEITGKVPVSMISASSEEHDAVHSRQQQNTMMPNYTRADTPRTECYGKPEFFKDDDDCRDCRDYKGCSVEACS